MPHTQKRGHRTIGTRAGLLGTGAMLPSSHAPPTCPPRRRRPRTRRGAGFGRNTFVGPPPRASPSVWGVYVLVPIWLGAPRPAWRPDPLIDRGPAGFLGRYLVTVCLICQVCMCPTRRARLHFGIFLNCIQSRGARARPIVARSSGSACARHRP